MSFINTVRFVIIIFNYSIHCINMNCFNIGRSINMFLSNNGRNIIMIFINNSYRIMGFINNDCSIMIFMNNDRCIDKIFSNIVRYINMTFNSEFYFKYGHYNSDNILIGGIVI